MTTSEKHANHVEVEYQFEGDLEVVERWLESQPSGAVLSFVRRPDVHQRDTYFDTDDWAFNRARFTLRLRRKGDESEATLKAFGEAEEGVRRRVEINQALPAGTTELLGTDGPVADRVRLLADKKPLRALFDVITTRRPYLIQENGRTVAELTLDDAKVAKATGEEMATPIRRVEIEESEAEALPRVQTFVEALREETHLAFTTTSKFGAGLQAAGLTPPGKPDFGPTLLSPELTAGEYGLAQLRRYFRDFLSHEGGTRLGEDSEELHDMRVAARRLRSALKTFEAVLPPEFAAFSDGFRPIGRALGEVRDLDVQLDGLEERQASADWEEANALAPLIERVRKSREKARSALLETLNDASYAELVEEFGDALRTGLIEVRDELVTAPAFGSRSVKQGFRKFRQEAKALTPTSPSAEFHAVRIRARKLRYRIEVFQPIFGKPAARMIAATVEVQDALGELHDSYVAMEWLHRLAREEGAALAPATLVLIGRMMEEKRARAQALRDGWRTLMAKTRAEWRALRRTVDRTEDRADAEEIEVADTLVKERPPVVVEEKRRWLSGFRRLPLIWRRGR